MKTSITSLVGWLLLISALLFYTYGIEQAIAISWDGKVTTGDYPEVLQTCISSIQALLLANLGAVLGISVTKPNSALAQQVLFKPNSSSIATAALPAPLELKEKVQLFALIIYILSLIACLIVWIHSKFSTDSKLIVSIIPQSGQMFIGVVLAYLTALFN